MPKTIRNEFDKKLSYESLMKAHKLSRKGKNNKYRKELEKDGRERININTKNGKIYTIYDKYNNKAT